MMLAMKIFFMFVWSLINENTILSCKNKVIFLILKRKDEQATLHLFHGPYLNLF